MYVLNVAAHHAFEVPNVNIARELVCTSTMQRTLLSKVSSDLLSMFLLRDLQKKNPDIAITDIKCDRYYYFL
jgi:hypothetical protein